MQCKGFESFDPELSLGARVQERRPARVINCQLGSSWLRLGEEAEIGHSVWVADEILTLFILI